MSTDPINILAADYHRNGVSGTGFFIGLFEYVAHPGKVYQIIAVADDDGPEPTFHTTTGSVNVFVLRTSDIASHNVTFGQTSHRGDHFIEEAAAIVNAVCNRPVGH